jgi:hypothetical protein
MSHLYKIIFKGDLLEGFDSETVIRNLATVSKMDSSKAEKMLRINKPTVLKKGLNKLEADKLVKLLTTSGLQVYLKRYENFAQNAPEAPQVRQHPTQAPEEPTEKPKKDNPYAAPVADLGVKNVHDGEWLDTPRKVSAARGWQWINAAFKMFFSEPFKWLAMGIIAAIISTPIVLIPIVGSLLYYIPVMIFAGGFMIAAQKQMEGHSVEIKDIFSGFSNNRNQLAMLGVLYLVSMFAIGLVVALLFFITLGTSFLPMMMGQAPDPEVMAGSMGHILMIIVIFLVAFGLSIPMLMAVWFSTPLVSLGNQSAVQAFKLSFQACLKNMLPFLVYGLAFFVIGIVFIAAFGIVSSIFSFFMADGNSIFVFLLPVAVMFLLGLPLMMISGLSVYTGFVDIFSNSTANQY